MRLLATKFMPGCALALMICVERGNIYRRVIYEPLDPKKCYRSVQRLMLFADVLALLVCLRNAQLCLLLYPSPLQLNVLPSRNWCAGSRVVYAVEEGCGNLRDGTHVPDGSMHFHVL
jgi:hypothetical protein